MTQAHRIVKEAIGALLAEEGSFAPRDLARRTGLTRQALHAHIGAELAAGFLVREGQGRSTRYRSAERGPFTRRHATEGLDESSVWLELRAELAMRLPERGEETDAILSYVVTELVNNAIDHSRSPTVCLRAEFEDGSMDVTIEDTGIGAFESVRERLALEDHLHALQAISKGKTTTDPERHTGEGLFFSSKAVDHFELRANGLVWMVDNLLGDQAILEEEPRPGTLAHLSLATPPTRSLRALFESFTTDLAFDRTRAVVRLFEHGTRFVSRSEAKRLCADLERFREVELDFHGVQGVGQGFVDELFRVWATAHPDTRLVPTRMNDAVAFMLRRGGVGS